MDRLPSVDRKSALGFLQDLASRNLSERTLLRYVKEVVGFHEWLGKPLTKATVEDLRGYVRYLLSKGRASYGVRVTTVILKLFLGKWMGKSEVKEVKLPKAERPLPKPLDESEILSMIKVGEKPYEKALVAVLYEGGLRLGELRNIKIGDVAVDQYGARVTVNGKSGERPIRLIHSTPFLQAFLEHHPFREDLEAYLFFGRVSVDGEYKPDAKGSITHTGVAHMLKRLAAKAGVNGKRIYPHLLRHSRATVLSKNMTDRELMTVFGWRTPSMVGVYSHLSMKDVEDKLLSIAGVKAKAEQEQSPLAPKTCPRCKFVNPATSRFCSQCSMILDLNTAMQLEEARARADSVMSKLLEDLETQRFLASKIKQLHISK